MVYHLFASLKELIKQFLSPHACLYCKKFFQGPALLCFECDQLIIPIATKKLPITQKYSATVFAISDYQDPIRSLIMAKHGRNRVVSLQLGQLLWDYTDLKYVDFDIIVPVPLHWTRYAWRWFNQAQVMAQQLSLLSGKPVVQLLKRPKKTPSQAKLNRAKRLINLENAFQLTKNYQEYTYKKILLIDDVMTTGTTLKACSKVLLAVRPLHIFIGVGCRTL